MLLTTVCPYRYINRPASRVNTQRITVSAHTSPASVPVKAAPENSAFNNQLKPPSNVHTVTFITPKMVKSVQSRDGANLYTVADHSGVHLPASCKQGACSACVCKVVEGNVKHTVDPACLTPRLKAEGYVAVCVANVSGDVSLQTHMGAKVRQARAEEADRMRHKHG